MKILIIANGIIGDDPSPSGGDVRFFMLAKYWQMMGHEIHLLSSQSCQRLIDLFELNATLHVLPWNDNNVGRLSFVTRAWQALWDIPESLDSFEGVVYTANDSLFDVLSGWKIKKSLGEKVRWAAIVHWMPPFPPWKRRQSSVVNSILFFINERMSVFLADSKADAILPVSITTEEQLKNAGINMDKVFPVKCGVNYQHTKHIADSVVDKKYDAVFMKRIQGVKGVFDLVKIWEKVVKEKPDAKLVVIGDEGEDAVRVRNLIANAGISDNIEFTGYIYDIEKKFRIVSSARIFILPSYEENWAISLGEALCCGLSTIAYDLRELTKIWEDTTHWVPLGDVERFSQKILEILGSQDIQRSDKKRGQEFMKKLDWEVLAQEELQIINNSGSVT